MCHLSVFAGIYARNLLFRLFGGKSATLCIKSLISHDITARQSRRSPSSPYFACEIKIHQKMSTKRHAPRRAGRDGVPLFVEEVTRLLLERGEAWRRSGHPAYVAAVPRRALSREVVEGVTERTGEF
jgi:hypothetical protein